MANKNITICSQYKQLCKIKKSCIIYVVAAVALQAQFSACEELQAKLARKENFVLLDVRTPEEFAEGHIGGSVLLPYDQVEQKAASLLPDKDKPIIVYCRSGRRSAIAAVTLRGLGYKDVKDFGGISRWQGELER